MRNIFYSCWHWLLHGSEPLSRLDALRALNQVAWLTDGTAVRPGYRPRFRGVIPRKVQISRLRAVHGRTVR